MNAKFHHYHNSPVSLTIGYRPLSLLSKYSVLCVFDPGFARKFLMTHQAKGLKDFFSLFMISHHQLSPNFTWVSTLFHSRCPLFLTFDRSWISVIIILRVDHKWHPPWQFHFQHSFLSRCWCSGNVCHCW